MVEFITLAPSSLINSSTKKVTSLQSPLRKNSITRSCAICLGLISDKDRSSFSCTECSLPQINLLVSPKWRWANPRPALSKDSGISVIWVTVLPTPPKNLMWRFSSNIDSIVFIHSFKRASICSMESALNKNALPSRWRSKSKACFSSAICFNLSSMETTVPEYSSISWRSDQTFNKSTL